MQKSNIFEVATESADPSAPVNPVNPINPINPAPAPRYIIDIEKRQDSNGATSGIGWSFDVLNGVLTINDTTGNTYEIIGTGTQTSNRVVVTSGADTNIILSDVNIDVGASNDSAFDMTGAEVKLYLKGTNTLISGGLSHAGLEAPDGSTLTITSAKGDGFLDGSLNAYGSFGSGAGIGGGGMRSGGNITINGGTVTATSGNAGGAGIGGGGLGDGGTITINGGMVTATASALSAGAGIGSGGGGYGGNITIDGGTVTATGGQAGAGIGGGAREYGGDASSGSGGIITITGGVVTAIGGSSVRDYDGAGIGGGGWGGDGGNITITGGVVTAIGVGGAGIGGGSHTDPTYVGSGGGIITISGGMVIATSNDRGAGIGGGGQYDSSGTAGQGGTVTISGGTVIAESANGAGIGGGSNPSGVLGSGGVATITGGSVHTSDNLFTGGIQSQPTNGAGGNVYLAALTVDPPIVDTEITAGSIGGVDCAATPNASAGVYGINDVLTDASGNVYFWLPAASSESIELTAGGLIYGNNSVSIGIGNNSAATLSFKGISDRGVNTLAEIRQFYNASGVFTVNSPQVVTIYQGDGKNTQVTLYADDTMYSVAKKINDAIANGLDQGRYVSGGGNFCAIADGTENTSESVYKKVPVYSDPTYNSDGTVKEPSVLIGYKTYATMLVRSAIPGAGGELYFSGDEDVLQALGLNTIQQSKESEFTVTVYDAHTGNMINSPQQVSGNVIYGAVTDNIDVKFNPLANISVSWNEKTKSYNFSQISEPYTTIVHIANNETVLQVGANEQEDLTIRLGNMSASALGLDGILVVSRELASRAITRLDAAITKVSKQRATLGAYQNRLEHTITNLTTASTNTTAAESRIRDADMSKEMLNFTRLQILTQSGTSMLAQANQLPQTVISLIRG
ncbi:hypothetical protein AGMMS50276_11130 [Synergistales bacterium]|nr:hypothetical protein AGMMS50276_11130 [Synergistales bacterium]